MSWIDWALFILPVAFVMYMGWRSKRYIRGVADYLSAGRVCGRYVLNVADMANALGVISMISIIEVRYRTGYAMIFWSNITVPVGLVLALSGYCFYRFRETRAMSLGQFIEMRYESRALRFFASALRSTAEILANIICPAIAARFFIYFFDLPHTLNLFGWQVSTFSAVVLVCLGLCLALILFGGTLALIITDTIQGIIVYPLLILIIGFILIKFSWHSEIVPVLNDRVAGESFLNPFDVDALRDFNLFGLVVGICYTLFHQASWIGSGTSTAAKSPHEQKMASLLGTWRGGFSSIFYCAITVTLLLIFNHQNYAAQGREVKCALTDKIAAEIITSPETRSEIHNAVSAIGEQHHQIGIDPPLSEKNNLDTAYLNTVSQTLGNTPEANQKFQEFRTLYHQLMTPMVMRHLLPAGLMGLFALLVILMMISTDDSYIFSSVQTLAQDCVLPFLKKEITPEQHVKMIRVVAVLVCIIFFLGASFMSQLDYLMLYAQIMANFWLGGCGPVMVLGLYSRFGTKHGAWASLLCGAGMSLFAVLVQRNWADTVYPFLVEAGWAEGVGAFLETVSAPFNPYVVWTMDPVKCPINSYEFFFLTMMFGLLAYILFSIPGFFKPFNLEKMLHRGQYRVEGEELVREKLTLKVIFGKMLGITSEYTRGDKAIAWGVFVYSFIWSFVVCFIAVLVWNLIAPWPAAWWSTYFLWQFILIPGVLAAGTSVWFAVGGIIDLKKMLHDLAVRKEDASDDGRVKESEK